MQEINIYLLYFLVFMFGASIGSFLLVFLERGNILGRSICNNCLRQLNFFELVPIFSYLFLKGKCRKCKTKIPKKLILGEIMLGLWFLGSCLYFYNIYELIFSLFFGSLFFLLVIDDIENMEVAAKYTYLFVAMGIVFAIYKLLLTGNYYEILIPALLVLPFAIIYLINKNAFGLADVYIYLGLSLFFGLQFTISLFFYSVYLGAVYGIFYLAFIHKKFERGVRIPFLPSIFLSTIFIMITNFHLIKIQYILALNEILFK